MRGNEKYLTLTPVKAIRAYCMECCDGQYSEIKRCPKDGEQSALCPLWRYRLGHRPKNDQNYGDSDGDFDSDDESEEIAPTEESDGNIVVSEGDIA